VPAKYRKITDEQQVAILSDRITQMEHQHRIASVNLIAAKAVTEATGAGSGQQKASQDEVEELERNLTTMDAALDALYAEEEKMMSRRPKASNDLDTMTKASLQEVAVRYGLGTSGSRNELLARIKGHESKVATAQAADAAQA
jgi:hypothetical protein